MKLRFLALLLVTLVFLAGCADKSPEPDEAEQSLPKTYYLYGQSLPLTPSLAKKIFVVNPTAENIQTKYASEFKKVGDGIYELKDAPYYIIDLKERCRVDSITIINSATYGPAESRSDKRNLAVALIELAPDIGLHPYAVYIAGEEAKALKRYNTAFKDGTETITFDPPIVTRKLHVKFSLLKSEILGQGKYNLLYRDYGFKLDARKLGFDDEVVTYTLRNRQDKDDNELLMRRISKDNVTFFYRLREYSDDYILPGYSIARLPHDADLGYARKNSSKIIQTGRYLTKSGTYKVVKMKLDDEKIAGHSVDTKIKTSKPKRDEGELKSQDGYIDFSGGI